MIERQVEAGLNFCKVQPVSERTEVPWPYCVPGRCLH